MTAQQPEALRLAEQCDNFEKLVPISAELRRLHARVQELEAQQERKPLSDEDVYELTHSAGPKLVELGQKWADNEIHVYQYASQAESIVDGVVRATERAHGIKQEPA